ncbi:MAG: hypothetical protein ACK4RK_15715 [Gemmataceae bacterium]
MFDWLWTVVEYLRELPTWQQWVFGMGFFLLSFFGSIAAVGFVIVRMPATYFRQDHQHIYFWGDQHPILRWIGLIVKNLFGLLLVAVGAVLALPGVPGQGILTILIGLMLLDFPGKRTLERKLITRPQVLASVNRLRQRFGKPPLVLDDDDLTSEKAADAPAVRAKPRPAVRTDESREHGR